MCREQKEKQVSTWLDLPTLTTRRHDSSRAFIVRTGFWLG